MIILIGIVLLVIREERIELNALFEIFYGFQASNVFQEIKVSINIEACSDESVPVNTL